MRTASSSAGQPAVAEHRRCFGRGKTVYNPCQDVQILARKTGSLSQRSAIYVLGAAASDREGAARAEDQPDGDRQMVAILSSVLADGLGLVEDTRHWITVWPRHRLSSTFWHLPAMPRLQSPFSPPDASKVRQESHADCARYISLRRTWNAHRLWT